MIKNRLEVTEKIIATKVSKGLTWEKVAKEVGLSKEWVTAACLGQMTLNDEQAKNPSPTPDIAVGQANATRVIKPRIPSEPINACLRSTPVLSFRNDVKQSKIILKCGGYH